MIQNKFSQCLFVIVFAALFASVSVSAQKFNLGLGIGAMNYKGDLAPKFNPAFSKLGVNGFFRYNLSPSISLRLAGTAGSISASDAQSNDPFNLIRNESFNSFW